MDTKEKTITLEDVLSKNNLERVSKLILWNDDFNSFEWVITCLISILKFNVERAEKTAWEVHLKGKSIIKDGNFEDLTIYKELLETAGLTLTIEK